MELIGKIIGDKYRIRNKISDDNMSRHYLVEDADNNPFTLKLLKNARISNRTEDIIRFHSDLNVISRNYHENIMKIHEVAETTLAEIAPGTSHYIMMEHMNGMTLHDFLLADEKPSIEQAVNMAIHICRALEYSHALGIHHREVRPANIFIPRDNGAADASRLKLTDFGISHVKEYRLIDDPDEIVATFSYLSPEQTGMIKRAVDERSDLYSLGIILYHLVTGKVPFQGRDITSILHQQVAKMPEPPVTINNRVPRILNDIILKLTDKEPDNRYQSANGLLGDLAKYSGGQKTFLLGLGDRFTKLTYRTGLVGREDEFNRLRTMFDGAREGQGRTCFISGEAGRGKSRLVDELREHVYSTGGMCVYGKCFSGANKVPYGPFMEALNMYIKNFLTYPESKKSDIRHRMHNAVSNLGQVIVRLNPAMEVVLGECPPLIELEPERENARFLTVAAGFFLELGRIEQGLVLVIDDLQWSDDGSLELFKKIVQDISASGLLLIGCYRDDEVSDNDRLRIFTEELKEKIDPNADMRLDLFDIGRMGRFVAGLLYEREEAVKEISEFIFQKSKGNPFFSIQVLKQLIDEKAVYYKNNRWNLQYNILNRIEISGTIIDILLKRISMLDEDETKVLSYAAVIGKSFIIDLLFKLVEYEKDRVVTIVDRAKQLQLLEEDLHERGRVLFVHDRIMEAFSRKISKDKFQELHLKIAAVIEETNRHSRNAVLFDLAYHYIASGNKDKMLAYSYPAGIKAKDQYANEEALRYLNIALFLLEEKVSSGGEDYRAQWVECKQAIGDIHFIIGDNDRAIETYTHVLPFKKTGMGKALIYKQMCHTYYKKGDYKNCEEYGRKGLRLLGKRLPINKFSVVLGILWELHIRLLHILFPGILIRNQKNSESAKHELHFLFYVPLVWTYVLSNKLKFIWATLRSLNFAESRLGATSHHGRAMAGYATLLMSLPWFKPAFKYLQKGLGIAEETHNKWAIAQSYEGLAYCYSWKGEYPKALEYFKMALERFKEIGDNTEIGMTLNGMSNCYLLLNDTPNLKNSSEWYYKIANKSGDSWQLSVSMQYMSILCYMLNNFRDGDDYAKKSYDLSKEKHVWYPHCLANILLGNISILKNQTGMAIKYLERARDLYERNEYLKHYCLSLYCLLTLAYIREYNGMQNLTSTEKKNHLKKINFACRDALKKTRPWVAHYGFALRLYGEYLSLKGNLKKAEKFYIKSIDENVKTGVKVNIGHALHQYGNLLHLAGREQESRSKYESAYRIFKETGFVYYQKILADKLGIKEDSTSMKRLKDRQRLSSVINVTQDISSILNLDELLEQVMSKALEVTGAQRGYLFIYDEPSDSLELRVSKGVIDSKMREYSKQIIDEAFKNRKAIIISNAATDEKYGKYDGVSDFSLKSILCMPIRHHERPIGICYLDNPLSTNVFSDEDNEIMNVLMTQAAISIENASLYANLEEKVRQRTEQLKKAMDSLWGELELAKKIQTALLPERPGIDGYEITGFMKTADEVGGDYYDVVNAGGRDWIVIGDVSGHGITAGLIMMMVQTAIHIALDLSPGLPPSQLLENINRTISENMKKLGGSRFMTITVLMSAGDGVFHFAGLHENILVYRAESGLVESVNTEGMWIGLHEDIKGKMKDKSLKLEEGDMILLFTDGIIEAWRKGSVDGKRHSERDMFGENRLIEIFQRLGRGTTGEVTSGILKTLEDYNCIDDVTMVVLKRSDGKTSVM